MTREAYASRSSGARATSYGDPVAAHGAIGKRTLVDAIHAAPVAGGAAVQRRGAAGNRAPEPEAVKAAAARGTSGAAGTLPHLARIQAVFGRHDVSGTRSYVGGPAAEGAAAMGAQAFASGDQVAFASAPDLHTAAHEAAHVVQQRGGVQLKGGVGEDGDVHERHADAVADRVVQGKSAEDLLDGGASAVTGGGMAVQRKVKVAAEDRTIETLRHLVVDHPHAAQVLEEMVAAETEFPFASEAALVKFVAELAKTNWRERLPLTDEQAPPDERVTRFAGSRLGKHLWASDNRDPSAPRVTRTNTLNKQFTNRKNAAKLPQGSHQEIAKVQGHVKKQGQISHVYSAMMTSLSPAAGDKRAVANSEVHDDGSVMNCEQFVAYTLWGGGVIRDWELALIFAACARANGMAFLYRAMGFDAAQPVVIADESLQLPAVSVLFEVNGKDPAIENVSHMLLYTAGAVIELNAGKNDPNEWKARSIAEGVYARGRASSNKPTFACPVTAIGAQLRATLNAIVAAYPIAELLGPCHTAGEPTQTQRELGFLSYEQQ